MRYKTAIERFKLYDPRIPDRCIEQLDRALRLHNPERVEDSIPIFENTIELYSHCLSATSLAEIFIALAFSYLVTDRLDKSRAAIVSVMEMVGLDDFYYGFAQMLAAQVEIEHKHFEKATAIIDNAEKSYRMDPAIVAGARELVADAKMRETQED